VVDAERVERRGRPKGTVGATVLYYVGEQAPADLRQPVYYRRLDRVGEDQH